MLNPFKSDLKLIARLTPIPISLCRTTTKKLMGVIDVQGISSFSIHCSESNLRKSRALKKPFCSFVRKDTSRVYCVQASSETVYEHKNLIMGDSFIRPHLRQLSAYQPILPFEVRFQIPSLVLEQFQLIGLDRIGLSRLKCVLFDCDLGVVCSIRKKA